LSSVMYPTPPSGSYETAIYSSPPITTLMSSR